MLLGLDTDLWKILLALLLVPLATVGLLNLALRRRGGVGLAWAGCCSSRWPPWSRCC